MFEVFRTVSNAHFITNGATIEKIQYGVHVTAANM